MGKQHTPEPWRWSDGTDGWLFGANGEMVLYYTTSDDGIHCIEADGRRIVACVNACVGIPTASLEAGVIAELVAACEAAVAYIPGSEVNNWPPGHRMKADALRMLRAALARVKGDPHGT